MKSISKIWMVIAVLLSGLDSFAQIKNLERETVRIYGNCETCKKTIEKAGNVKHTAAVVWDKDTHMATLRYDSQKTGRDEILKRIALAGYDSEEFLAPDEVYAQLPACCRYERVGKPVAANAGGHEHNAVPAEHKMATAPLDAVFDNYFSIKDALVKTDVAVAAAKATDLLHALKAVDQAQLAPAANAAWVKATTILTTEAAKIAAANDVSVQRAAFAALAAPVYELAKAGKPGTPVYYQHCPMYDEGKGAHWLSQDESIKNPYYGARMLTCGSTVETLD